MKKITIFVTLLIFSSLISGFSQGTEPDPGVQKAKEETVVVYDMGRFFGYVNTMITEDSGITLTPAQFETFFEIMQEIRNLERIEPNWADDTLDYLELDVLTVDQLMYVDEIALARIANRENQSGAGAGTGAGATRAESGAGPIQAYITGGAFNPIIDETKSIGEDFFELLNYISEELGK
jgi:hypothetical protein